MNPIIKLTPQQLRRAASIQEKILQLQKKLNRMFGEPTAAKDGLAPRRKMSAAGRARIAAAARARWARQRSTKAPKAAPKRKRKFSAAARKRLAQLAKARWAKAKASGKKTL